MSARPLSGAITYPYLAAVLTILYFDQRVRKEGFDLQLLAEGFGVERDPDAPLPAPLIGDELYTPEQRAAAPYWPPPPGWMPPPAEPQPSPWASPERVVGARARGGTAAAGRALGSGGPLRPDSEAPPPDGPAAAAA